MYENFLWSLYREYMLNIRREPDFQRDEKTWKKAFLSCLSKDTGEWMESMLFWSSQLNNTARNNSIRV